MTVRVSIVIVGFCNSDDIACCLGALAKSTYINFDVVIVENGGRDAHQKLLEILPTKLNDGQCVTVIDSGRNGGFAAGVNIGLQNSSDYDAWWILNPDTMPDANALRYMVEKLECREYDAVGSVLLKNGGVVQSLGGIWGAMKLRPISIGYGSSQFDPIDESKVERQMNYITGASILVSRHFLERNGFMREDYFLYCEEIEWCVRAKRKGLKLGLASLAFVKHNQGSTTGSGETVAKRPPLPVYLDERNKVLLIRDLHSRIQLPLALLGLLVIIYRFGIVGRSNCIGAALKGWWAGVKNERGIPVFDLN